MAAMAPRLLRWQPLAGAVMIVAVVLVWPDAGWKGGVWSLRAVALVLTMGALFFLDDASAEVTAPVPAPLWLRTVVRAGLALLVALPVWIVALLVERSRLPEVWLLWLSVEFAALFVGGLAFAALLGRGAPEPGVLAVPGLVVFTLAALAAPGEWTLLGLQTTDWTIAHVRWSVVLSVALAGLAWASRDPAWRRRSARPSSMATRP
ncbi:hypothetical protein GCM10009555_000130 [Acrocarpospora macrocephala]|uniref:ABC transporter n=2 Tax=Acrocarpospora macrocephala TaxID=150177 RepID=A0A5M3WSY2_9ACTN|nr:hypothetical protein Amac_052030 [Acrocarpospora macrocephala]